MPERLSPIEQEKKPSYHLRVTRHAKRLPSGPLSPEGIKSTADVGRRIGETAEVYKAYVGDHPSKRTFDTGDRIAGASGIKSSQTGEQYSTREVSGLQYDILNPDLTYLLSDAKNIVEEATLKESGLSTEKDESGKFKINIEELPLEEQIRIAPIRQKNQRLAFEFFLNQPDGVHRLAMGLAHQLLHELEIVKRYSHRKETTNTPLKRDAVIDTVTHGLFTESLFKEAAIYRKSDGEEMCGFDNFESETFGGFMQPAESWYLDIPDPKNIPSMIPVVFERENRPEKGTFFIDLEKLKELDSDFIKWEQTL